MSMVLAATAGTAVVGGVGSYLGGKEAGDAAEEAAKLSAASTTESIEAQEKMYEQTRADQEPWRLAGEKALQTIQERPDFQFTTEDFENFKDPAYEFRMQEGVNALDRSAASRGRLLSGAQDRAVTRYGSDLASQEYQNAFNRSLTTENVNLAKQQSLANVGQSATNVVSQAGQTTGSNIASTAMQGATQQGNAVIAGGQAQADMYSNIGQSANQAIGNYLLYQKTK